MDQDNTVNSSGLDEFHEQQDLMGDDEDMREMPPPMDAGPAPLLAFDDEPSTTTEQTNIESFEILTPKEDVKVEESFTTTTTTTQEVHTEEIITETTTTTEVKQEEESQTNGAPSVISKVIETKDYKELSSWPVQWMENHAIDKKIIKLIYWCEWQKTAGVFGGILFLLLSLTCYSFISVVSTFAMSLLAVSFLYRIGMTIVNAVQKTSAEHPLKNLLEEKIEFSEDTVKQISEHMRTTFNRKVKEAQQLFLIEDFVASLKFGVMLWLVSYIGSWFSMLTLFILGITGIFSLPIAYELYQKEVDQALDVAKAKIGEVYKLVESKLPASLKSATPVEKKEQ